MKFFLRYFMDYPPLLGDENHAISCEESLFRHKENHKGRPTNIDLFLELVILILHLQYE